MLLFPGVLSIQTKNRKIPVEFSVFPLPEWNGFISIFESNHVLSRPHHFKMAEIFHLSAALEQDDCQILTAIFDNSDFFPSLFFPFPLSPHPPPPKEPARRL